MSYVMDDSLVILLSAGQHTIHVDSAIEGPVCGLIPMSTPCRSVSTQGLRWNLGTRYYTPFSFVTLTENSRPGAAFRSTDKLIEPSLR